MYPLGGQAHSGLKTAAIAGGMTLVGYWIESGVTITGDTI